MLNNDSIENIIFIIIILFLYPSMEYNHANVQKRMSDYLQRTFSQKMSKHEKILTTEKFFFEQMKSK